MSKVKIPDFKLNEEIPLIRIKSIDFKNFKAFEDIRLNFLSDNICKSFVCFFGPNGSGKTTILDAISMIFSKYDWRDEAKLIALLGKSVRHVDGNQKAMYDDNSDFLITSQIECSLGDYEIQLTKKGFIKDHPEAVKNILQRVCFYAKFDQELHQFQLIRDKWDIFKQLFEAVTGFKIEEKETLFNQSDDPYQAEMMKKFVLGFMVHKPNEIISHKECSAGERKIIKSFSTLLNKEIIPSIVCIDNAEMHVESGRHIQLIESMKKCFPHSQIFATTHSYQISRNFGERNQLYDMRLVKREGIINKEPWRLYFSDEIKDCISKLKSFSEYKKEAEVEIKNGQALLERCINDMNKESLKKDFEIFLKKISHLFIIDTMKYYNDEK